MGRRHPRGGNYTRDYNQRGGRGKIARYQRSHDKLTQILPPESSFSPMRRHDNRYSSSSSSSEFMESTDDMDQESVYYLQPNDRQERLQRYLGPIMPAKIQSQPELNTGSKIYRTRRGMDQSTVSIDRLAKSNPSALSLQKILSSYPCERAESVPFEDYSPLKGKASAYMHNRSSLAAGIENIKTWVWNYGLKFRLVRLLLACLLFVPVVILIHRLFLVTHLTAMKPSGQEIWFIFSGFRLLSSYNSPWTLSFPKNLFMDRTMAYAKDLYGPNMMISVGPQFLNGASNSQRAFSSSVQQLSSWFPSSTDLLIPSVEDLGDIYKIMEGELPSNDEGIELNDFSLRLLSWEKKFGLVNKFLQLNGYNIVTINSLLPSAMLLHHLGFSPTDYEKRFLHLRGFDFPSKVDFAFAENKRNMGLLEAGPNICLLAGSMSSMREARLESWVNKYCKYVVYDQEGLQFVSHGDSMQRVTVHSLNDPRNPMGLLVGLNNSTSSLRLSMDPVNFPPFGIFLFILCLVWHIFLYFFIVRPSSSAKPIIEDPLNAESYLPSFYRSVNFESPHNQNSMKTFCSKTFQSLFFLNAPHPRALKIQLCLCFCFTLMTGTGLAFWNGGPALFGSTGFAVCGGDLLAHLAACSFLLSTLAALSAPIPLSMLVSGIIGSSLVLTMDAFK